MDEVSQSFLDKLNLFAETATQKIAEWGPEVANAALSVLHLQSIYMIVSGFLILTGLAIVALAAFRRLKNAHNRVESQGYSYSKREEDIAIVTVMAVVLAVIGIAALVVIITNFDFKYILGVIDPKLRIVWELYSSAIGG